MTTNRDWLFSLPLEEQIAWMESEHYEPKADYAYEDMLWADDPDCSAMLYKMFTENMKHEPCSDYEPKSDGDSRERLEADAERYIEHATFTLYDAIIELLDRQAAITEEQTRCKWVTASADEIAAWRSKAEKLKEQVYELTAERDNWKANCEDWEKHARAAENACYETMLEREDYRTKFGKCLDYADAIHALMDDEGLA